MENKAAGGEETGGSVFDVFAQSDAEPTIEVKQQSSSSTEETTDDPSKTQTDESPYDFLNDEKPVDNSVKDDASGDETPDDDQGNDQVGDLKTIIEGQLVKSLGRVVKLPDDVNEDNIAEKLMEMGRNTLHPEALRLQQAIESGVSPESYYKSYSRFDEALALDDKELVRRSIVSRYGRSDDRPDGWDESKINARLDRMDEIDIEDQAFSIRENIKSQKAQRDQQLAEGPRSTLPDPASPEFKKTFDEGFDHVFNEVMKDGDVYGVKFNTPDKQKAFAKRIKDVLYPDAKTRQNKFVEALQDPKESLRIAMLWDMVKSGQLQLNASKSSAAATRKLTDLLGKRKSAGAAPRAGSAPDFSVFSEPDAS